MDEALKRIKRQAGWAPNWFELAIGVAHLCDYIAELEDRLAKVESFKDAWLEVFLPPEQGAARIMAEVDMVVDEALAKLEEESDG